MASKTPVDAVAAKPRTGTFNKNHARRVRVQGLIPAVVYGAGKESVAITVDPKVIFKILYFSEGGHNTIFDLNIEGASAQKVMIVDWQTEPLKGKLLHADFKRIAMDKAMKLSVAVRLTGTSVGVKNGGILGQVMHEVHIECLPDNIPDHIDVDISNLEINQGIHISDLPHNDKIKFLDEEDALVAHVTVAKEEAASEVAAVTEPEVAKKGKTDAPAAAPAGDKKK
jgi:large subunit ribosomal protein L25